MAKEIPAFQHLQHAFAAAVRDPKKEPPPGTPTRRMQIYRRLAYNNLESFLATGFPIVKATLGEAAWPALIRDFLRRHQSRTPYLFELGEEFLFFLQNERGQTGDDPPFLLELAHYEWVELALLVSEAEPPEEIPASLEEPPSGMIILSELAWPLAYRFPVHRLWPGYQREHPPAEPTFLVVYRDRDDEVKFLEIGVSAFLLLETLKRDGPMGVDAALRATGSRLNALGLQPLASGCQVLLEELARLSVIGACG